MGELQDAVAALQAATVRQAAVSAEVGVLVGQVARLVAGNGGGGVVIPVGANMVRAGGVSSRLAAVNPVPGPGRDFPGGRGTDELVLYKPPVTRTGTNAYGSEVAVVGGVTVGRPTTGGVGGLYVPPDGYVLSGHGVGSTFVAGIPPSTAVEVLKVDEPPPPPPGARRRVMAVYVMDGVGRVEQLPPECNRLLVAFWQTGGLVEWGGDSPAHTAADFTVWARARPGNEIVVTLGGQGGQVDLSRVAAGMGVVNGTFPVSGIDFDAEGWTYTPEQAVSVSRATASAVGRAPEDFVVQFVPPGGPPVGPALSAAKACQDAGFRVTFGQQLYETTISDADVMRETKRAVDVLGQQSVLVGMMLGDRYGSWTVESAVRRIRAVVAQWPDIGGVYLWESSRAGTTEWGSRVGAATLFPAIAPVLGR